ncbi:MAG: saccharopine dehydrogenase NADP-binding domain-containing protein [Bacteroidetes bacterium]|nr:saccharopine dehydrogenase NADP-binding domain-containing protein [Bacteroidota bacterium]
MKIAILGAGMVGRTIAKDLALQYDVTSIDNNSANLLILKAAGVNTLQVDLQQFENYELLLAHYDLCVLAVPGFMGFEALRAVINAGKNVVDISFSPENTLRLNDLANQKNITVIVDCGVAPGLSNLVLGHCDAEMQVESFECLVGGLPKLRIKPFEFKAPFSPIDVIEEYTRPARYVENGNIITRPALSDAQLHHFNKVGTLESFNTDGLRSLIERMPHIKNMKEKTLRYPGHIDLIQSLMDAGFFNDQKISINNVEISPRDLTLKLLFDQWKLHPDEEEFTLMQMNISGQKDGHTKAIEYFLYDEYDVKTKTSSMSRTTGYTCAAAVNLIAKGLFNQKGVFPPETLGADKKCFDFILNYLKERKVKIEIKEAIF